MIRGLREGALIIFGTMALYLLASLGTYDAQDPGWSHSETGNTIVNAGGVAGAWFADIFLFLFGYLAYLVPVGVAYLGWLLFTGRKQSEAAFDLRHGALRTAGFFLTLGAGTGLAELHFADFAHLPVGPGGVLGDVVGSGLVSVVNPLGGTLFLLALFLTGVTLLTSLSWLWLMDVIGRATLNVIARVREGFFNLRDEIAGRRARQKREATIKIDQSKAAVRKPLRIEPVIKPVVKVSVREEKERQVPLFDMPVEGGLPALSLLDPAEERKTNVSTSALEAISRQVELKLADFGVEAQVVEVHPGPVVTRYELDLAPGLKVSKITNLAKDLARSLSAISVRVVEVIPGKSTIGLELPNEHREMVRLSEIIKSEQYENANSPLTLALGVDISGTAVVADLAKMPHLLVAGTTGSGKSVGLNAMVLSVLYNATPGEVRMIMIDPKMLELSVYEGIPHLLAPVVTDMKEAANALRWCVAEMERRYKLMAHMGVRNVAGFNRKVNDAIEAGEPLKDPFFKPIMEGDEKLLETMPQIVVVVDELADMMMTVGKKVEELIARLAQKARAASMHLILATQRPSVDVLTGLIKANIPTRMAFQVSAKVDSRTILDQGGAEQLLGHGDMLYLPPGISIPTRVHGAFVSDAEVHRVVADWRSRGEPQYIDEVLEGPAVGTDMGGMPGETDENAEMDALYDEAVRIVTETRKASISSVQRRLRIGYNRAARMVEEMERTGVVGPVQTNGMREVIAPPPPVD
ncbi:MAG: DNA translocase FtsK 4TM domain-containing protein [Gammaproteobacteria bacterium]|nr:DNA translocase FtsK 4TM domain-containing protein [Gammaproteobacteria bacterium]MCF6259170.1 DNA translocase FtsK 4TM domain-containing protein [Gammaproteobacteria bacterium]